MSEERINEIPAGQLERGQHVIRPRNGVPTVYRIENTFGYTRDGAPMVALLLSPIGGGVPIDDRKWAQAPVAVASEDQVAEAVDAVRGDTVVRGLRAFADLMADLRPKTRAYGGPSVSVHVLDGEVSRIADALSLPLSDYGQTSKSVLWQSETSDFSDGVSVTFYGKPAEPEPEHAHVGGTIGGPGENEVECACGLVFGGFDSQASALAMLERHIADPQPADAQAGR